MDIGPAFSYVFGDKDWIKKAAIGGVFILLSIILVGIPFVFGYVIKTIQHVRDGQPGLPEWEDYGGLFKIGLMAVVLGIVYYLPVILLSCIVGVISAAIGQNTDASTAMTVVMTCLNILSSLLSIVISLVFPAAIIRYANTNDFKASLQFGEVFKIIKENLGNYVIAVIISGVAMFVAEFGVILCVIGVFLTMFWGYMVSAHLYGQIARKVNTPAPGMIVS
jgi:hypothetical protein